MRPYDESYAAWLTERILEAHPPSDDSMSLADQVAVGEIRPSNRVKPRAIDPLFVMILGLRRQAGESSAEFNQRFRVDVQELAENIIENS